MKIVTVVGARPQFIKAAPLSRALRENAVSEVLLHTGQHYDEQMSSAFFRELELPSPDYNLGIGSSSHGEQTGAMLKGIEQILAAERPAWVVVYGDTNSTLAGALAAVKLGIPVAHVEAGLRSFNRSMPEEINRTITDHVSSLLFCPTATAVKNLRAEGITAGVHLVGDIMYDSLRANLGLAERRSDILACLDLRPKGYLLATVHRAENTDDPTTLVRILGALGELARAGHTVVFPMHPRTRARVEAERLVLEPKVKVTEPVPYLDMLSLERGASVILTDSGGVQKEAVWLDVPCVTMRAETEWVETVRGRANVLAGTATESIVAATLRALTRRSRSRPAPPEGPGATSKILRALVPTVVRARSATSRSTHA
jgi:UDP-N-acetylglucosamine 2-epimerase